MRQPIPHEYATPQQIRASKGEHTCMVCRRHLRNPKTYIWVVEGGGTMACGTPDNEETEPECSDLGLLPVGSECVKLIPKEYRIKKTW